MMNRVIFCFLFLFFPFLLLSSERLFWDESPTPRLISRVFENHQGQAQVCLTFEYNAENRIIKETIYGNLSGECSVPLCIQASGQPIENGIEHYTRDYAYCSEAFSSISKLYPNNLKNWDLDLAKAPGFDPSKTTQYYNMGSFSMVKSRELSLKSKTNFSSCLGIDTDSSKQHSLNNEFEYQYDEYGRVIKTIFPSVKDQNDCVIRPTISQEYDCMGRIGTKTDANGYKTHFTYNAYGSPIKIEYPDGSVETFRYFLDGSLREKTDKSGRRIIYQRDPLSRVIGVECFSPSGKSLQKNFFHYQGESISEITDDSTFTQELFYDEKGHLITSYKKTNDGSQRMEWEYDSCGQCCRIKEWFGEGEKDFIVKVQNNHTSQNPMEITFENAEGLIQKKLDLPKQSLVFLEEKSIVNDLQQTVKQIETIDSKGIRTLQTHDALGRVEHIVMLNTLGDRLSEKIFRYDAKNNKTLEKHFVLVKGVVTHTYTITWKYDEMDRVLSICEGIETVTPKFTSFRYYPTGKLESVTKPDGITLRYSYNEEGLLSFLTSSDQSIAYSYHYDDAQHLVLVEDLVNEISLSRSYDAFGQMIEEKLGNLTFTHSYDRAGRRTCLALPDHSTIHYQYNGLLLASIERFSSDKTSLYSHQYLYDLDGQLTGSHLIADLGDLHFQKNDERKLISIQSPWWSEEIFREANNPDTILNIHFKDVAGEFDQVFDYTEDDQLCKEEGYFNNAYQYDSLFNRISNQQSRWVVNEMNQLIQSDRSEFKYDLNGNLIEKKTGDQVIKYEYDALNRLSKVIEEKNQSITYTYDAFNRRLSQSIYQWDPTLSDWALMKTERFYYDGEKEIGKETEGQIEELRVLGIGKGAEIGAAIAIELKGELFAPIHDHLGSIRCLVDTKTHNVVEFYRYSTFGEEEIFDVNASRTDFSDSIKNPWRYAGKRADLTGLIFFGQRYYDSSSGRWITPDPLPYLDGANVYTFVRNNPLTYYDMFGLFSLRDIWEGIVNMASKCVSYIQSACQSIKEGVIALSGLYPKFCDGLEHIGTDFLHNHFPSLLGYDFEKPEVGVYGQKEISDKVRVTFINGILTWQQNLVENLELISRSHGGVAIHYIFRPSHGWMWDVCKAWMIKGAYLLGFRSQYAHLLADRWRSLIEEMGGVNGGGKIIHYAHSLGGSDTDRARDLLTPEEQKMIRVYTIGSATLIRDEGFDRVVNHVSFYDGVPFIDFMGGIRNFFDAYSNVVYHKGSDEALFWPADHLILGGTYERVLQRLGEKFISDYAIQ